MRHMQGHHCQDENGAVGDGKVYGNKLRIGTVRVQFGRKKVQVKRRQTYLAG